MSDDDRPDARTRILDAAFAIVEESGEAALRFVDVAERAGVVLSLITRHYGTREGLVAAVQARRFVGLVAEDAEVLAGLVGAGSTAEITTVTGALTREVVAAERAERRLARVSSIGSIHGRPELTGTIRGEATRLLDGLTETLRALQAEGRITDAVDARALAMFVQAYSLGMVLSDLDTTPPSREDIAGVIEVAIGAFLR
jgi:AcrR family transcriptional regulator